MISRADIEAVAVLFGFAISCIALFACAIIFEDWLFGVYWRIVSVVVDHPSPQYVTAMSRLSTLVILVVVLWSVLSRMLGDKRWPWERS